MMRLREVEHLLDAFLGAAELLRNPRLPVLGVRDGCHDEEPGEGDDRSAKTNHVAA
jgi:hypothetical protein